MVIKRDDIVKNMNDDDKRLYDALEREIDKKLTEQYEPGVTVAFSISHLVSNKLRVVVKDKLRAAYSAAGWTLLFHDGVDHRDGTREFSMKVWANADCPRDTYYGEKS